MHLTTNGLFNVTSIPKGVATGATGEQRELDVHGVVVFVWRPIVNVVAIKPVQFRTHRRTPTLDSTFNRTPG